MSLHFAYREDSREMVRMTMVGCTPGQGSAKTDRYFCASSSQKKININYSAKLIVNKSKNGGLCVNRSLRTR